MFALVFGLLGPAAGLLGPAAAAGGDAFVFGTASAAWQYEGAADSRGDTIWDDFCSRDRPDGAPNCHNQSATATDQYNLTRLASDIELMRALGTTAYRLSLAWSRILPTGAGAVNEAAVGHYRTVLSMLRAGGIEPYVTLFHFDLPSPLERMGGWLNHSMADTFADYAGVCFHAFGDLVRFWITINEAHTIATAGYLYGVAAPGRCSDRAACAEGDGLTEPYLAAHTLLRAHAKAAAAYRVTQEPAAATAGGMAEGRGATRAGSITMVISGDHTEPWNTSSTADAAAAQRRQEFQIGWFADPMWFGDYPLSMRSAPGMRGGGGGGGSGGGGRGRGGGGSGGGRLPVFTAEEKALLRGSADYFALNHYTSRYARAPAGGSALAAGCPRDGRGTQSGYAPAPTPTPTTPTTPTTTPTTPALVTSPSTGWDDDQCCNVTAVGLDGQPIGPRPAGSEWLYAVPWGMRALLRWVHGRYGGAPVLVTENGCMDPVVGPVVGPVTGAGAALARQARRDRLRNDTFRVEYHRTYLAALRQAMAEDGVDVRGYFIWSLLDNVEWGDGLATSFGLHEVDHSGSGSAPSLARAPKASAGWIADYVRHWQPPPTGQGQY
jgi:beta-glucosidase